MRQKVWGWFSQPLDLKDFPIDQQTLTIHVAAAGLVEGDLKLVALEQAQGRQSGIHKGFSLPDFDVISWKAESRPYIPFEGEVGTPGYIMEIQIKRRPSYFIWKVIFPLCLIVIMYWIPRWLDPKESSTSIGISTTAFLTLVAYLFAITVLLPKVSYLTRMDDFILLSTLLVFVGLISNGYIDIFDQCRAYCSSRTRQQVVEDGLSVVATNRARYLFRLTAKAS